MHRGSAGRDGAGLVVRVALPPAEATDVLRIARALGRVRGGRDELERVALRSCLHVTSGVLRVAVPNVRTDTGWDEDWAQRLADLRRTLEVRGGSLVVSRAPRQVVARVSAWGDAGPAARLMREIKARFDPGGILSPGRFVIPDDDGGREGGGNEGVPSTNEDI
ncbi:MAG: hypothetical protein KY453_07220 [Gemmatimonadetes bacterium]|nr:hypothetical protein [Gemmatimonadota bacterium]